MLPPMLYLMATRHLHIPASPRLHGLYLATMVQFVQVVLLPGGGIAQHQPRLRHHVFTVQKSVVIPLIALLQQVHPRNYSSASGAMVKHLPEGQGLETMSSKSLV
jgi:hypothetical protein